MQALSRAVRVLWRERSHSLVVVLTMALGIGATTTLFGVVHGVLLEPLPWPGSERLIRLSESREGGTPRRPWLFTSHTYGAWAEAPETVEGLAAWRPWTATLTEAGEPSRLRYARASASLFELLQARRVAGRLFAEADREQDGVVLLSEGLWEERFGRSPEAIGRTLRLDGEPYRVVGVVDRNFAFPDRETRAWLPLDIPPAAEGTNTTLFSALALLRPGVTPRQAAEEATARAAHAPGGGPIEVALFGASGAPRVHAEPLLDSMTKQVRPALLLLFAAVGLLLLAATANVAGLQLASATARTRELAVRSALGAGRGRLAALLLSESVTLGLLGGASGLALAAAAQRTLPSVLPADFPRLDAIALDGRVTAFAVALSVAAGVAFGVLPALFAGRLRLTDALARDGSGSLGGGRSSLARARSAILVGQMSVACVLVAGGLQLSRSFLAQLASDRGYQSDGLLVAELTMPEGLYTAERRREIVSGLLERLEARPEVAGAAFSNLHPLSALDMFGVFRLRPGSEGEEERVIQASIRVASPGYFEVLGRRLLAGRFLEAGDSSAVRPVLVVNRSFADRYLGEAAVGSLIPRYGDGPDYEVVGVVEDVRPAHLGEARHPEVVSAVEQREGLELPWLSLLVRTHRAPEAFAPSLRALLREQDAALVPDRVRAMDALLGDGLAQPRLYSLLVGGFAACALGIAGVGLFGALSFSVARRRREIGLRMALGARAGDVVRLVGRRALALAGLGLALGLAATLAGGRALEGLLYGVRPLDAWSLLGVTGALALVAASAALLPARRAAAIEPQEALRQG